MSPAKSERRTGSIKEDASVTNEQLMERVLESENLRRAYRQVKRNKGSAGIDGDGFFVAASPPLQSRACWRR